jgi:hypothetical protein
MEWLNLEGIGDKKKKSQTYFLLPTGFLHKIQAVRPGGHPDLRDPVLLPPELHHALPERDLVDGPRQDRLHQPNERHHLHGAVRQLGRLPGIDLAKLNFGRKLFGYIFILNFGEKTTVKNPQKTKVNLCKNGH